MSEESVKIWKKFANRVVHASAIPFPLSDTLIDLLKVLATEEEAKFLHIFRKPSMNLEEIKEKSKLDEKEIMDMLSVLTHKGVIIESKSRRTGITVYTLMGPFPGMFEYSLMRGETGEREKKLVKLFEKIFVEFCSGMQQNYDNVIPKLKEYPPIARVIPVEEEIEVPKEVILSSEQVSKLIDQHETISLSKCYCRHEKDLIGDRCKRTNDRENCLQMGKVAEFCIKEGFSKPVSKDEAKKIMKRAEEKGLVHKVFHTKANVDKDIEAVCSCCPCCCGIFRLYYMGGMPLHTYSAFIAKINEEECSGCETCVDMCPMEAIEMKDYKATINENKCIGCGVCAHFCNSENILMERTGPRDVFVPPPKVEYT
ncbi:MAG: indolepyruvate ferredoxin oxidoreductase subunit alpha [Candidatus Hodarchaeota archaeon]